MNNHASSNSCFGISNAIVVSIVASSLLLANVHAAPTALATEPITSSSKINALPNIMFVLDDSGSMKADYLPDWAGPYQATISGVLTVVTPAHRFFNGAYNGVAYNPATRYEPPVMYTTTGAPDTTTYPSLDGQSATSGGDSSASASSPNWRAVKVDGYGIQSTASVNLEGNAFSYTTVAGEYCDSAQLRNCISASGPSGSYTFPAKLRWCTTSTKATDTTVNAGTACQASNIDDTPTNITNGVTPYTFARMPRPSTSTITVGAPVTVTSISVGGAEILSASALGATSTDVATAIAANINACTTGIPSLIPVSNCSVVGFSAVSLANVVTITAPSGTTVTPVVTGGTVTTTAFSNGNVPGSSLFVVITPSVSSYPYPGTASKGAKRTDCVGSTCTYAEEMTNYANWYSYYRTRMQMMKTASSIAFSTVDDKFRVGYYSINNGASSDFLNLSAFDGAQKNLWYTKFFSARPFGATPLRTGLSNIGRMYAGQLSTLNLQVVTDPVQYSCQQNYTILSTDGYWNDTSNPKKIDGTTDVGQQDNNLDRPYYDGGTFTRTVSQTTKTEEQLGINTILVESRTRQQQTSASRLDQTVVTTDTYPWTTQTTTLQTRTTPLDQTAYKLEQRSYPLTSITKELQESTYKLNSTPRILQSYINNLTKTTTPLEKRTYNITKSTQLLRERIYKVTAATQLVTKKVYNVTRATQLVTKKVYNDTIASRLVTKKVFNLTKSTYPLQSSTYKLQSSTRQLQKRMEVSTDGGDTWSDTGWVNATSCTVAASGPGYTRNTQCRYDTAVIAGGLNSCSTVAASAGPSYTVAQAVTCAYETTPVVAAVGSCNVVAQSSSSPYTPSVSCGYSATATVATGQTTCTARDQSALSAMTGDKVVCAYDSTSTNTTGLTTCTWVVPSPSASAPKTECSYETATTQTGQTSCTAATAASATTNGSVWNKAVTCSYDTTPTTTSGLSTCTWVVPSTAASAPKTECSYETATTLANQTTCSAVTKNSNTSNGQVWNTGVTCTYDATPTTTTGLSTCTWVVPSPSASASKTECSYQTATTLTGQNSCSAATKNSNTANGQVWNTGVTCSYDGTPTTTNNKASCTWVVPSPSASSPRTDCNYQTATTASGQTSCAAAAVGTVSTNGTTWNTGVSCAYDASPTTTLTNQASCTWVVPAPAASLPRTDCAYNAGAATTSTVATCTPVNQSTGTANGTVWSGPAVACAYAPAVLTGTNLTTCTAGTPSAVPPYTAYTTCGYINGTTTTGLNSCTYIADSTGPVYSGPANACAYSTTATVANVTSCTAVAQSPTFAAPQKTCAYQATGTSATNLTTCTNVPQSSGAYPWVGPNVACAYSGTASSTSLDVASCTVHDSGGSPYTGGAKVSCTYNNASPVVTSNVASCTTVAKSVATTDGTVYNKAYSCAYGSTTGWADATVACVPQAQSAGPTFVGPARECQYTSPPVDTYTATCTAAAENNTNLTARNCVPGSFPVTVSTVTTVVDSCSTAPTSDGGVPVERTTATTCAYRAPVVTSTATCTPHAADATSPYSSAITCPVSDTGYIPVAPTCSPAGTPPLGFDGTGKVVECRTTDTTPYTADYPSGPVPVASCTPGLVIDPVSKVQTTCTTMLSTGPAPVASCVTVNPPVAPSYVKTLCNTTATSSTVMGCSAPAASAPLWQTVTCTDDGNGTINTLADVASYYYWTDLRTSALGNCTGTPVPPATTGNVLCTAGDDVLPLVAATPGDPVSEYNNVPTTPADPHKKQHMTTFTLGLGASGYMKFSDTYTTDTSGDFTTVKGVSPYAAANGIAADPTNGVCSWQSSGNCNWPFPASDEQTTIDDLWHAGVNGHGAYFSATDPVSLSSSISQALNTVAAAGGTSAAPALSNPSLSPGDSYVFSSSYTSLDWTGELIRLQLDPYDGTVLGTIDWSAQAKLDAKAVSTRNIYVYDASVASTHLKAFTSANFAANSNFLMPHISASPNGLTQYLCASPSVCLSSADQTDASGAKLVDFLRGDRTNEDTLTVSKYYRLRQHVLGDMVNAQTVYVNKPLYDYADPGYSAFVSSVASRQAVVYAGANDGMLHAFAAKGTAATEAVVEAAATATAAAHQDTSSAALATAASSAVAAATAALASDTTIGQELWAYIPTMVIPNLYKLADKNYKSKHAYFVDATPVAGDICTSNCTVDASAVWKSILVGGLGRGGRGYYALDITNPSSPKALWEFTDANLGYSFGNPVITKMCDDAACATKTWVVLITSGYNNIPNDDGAGGDGVGRLYVINAATGALIRTISTGVGDVTSPSGLARISGYAVNPQSDNTVDVVYGGDLLGNLWRFDVNDKIGSSSDANAGYDAQLLAVLEDGSGNPQPITTTPELAEIPSSKVRVVYVGTGRFLAGADASDASQQSIYAIKDERAVGTAPSTAIFNNPGGSPRVAGTSAAGFVQQVHSTGTCPSSASASTCVAGQDVILSTSNPVDFTLNNGWFVDLINSSERANTDPALVAGLLVFNTNAPSLLACDVGGKGYQYWFDYKSGAPIGEIAGFKLGNQLYSAPTIISTNEGLKVLSGSSGTGPDSIKVTDPDDTKESMRTRRTSWREWIREQ